RHPAPHPPRRPGRPPVTGTDPHAHTVTAPPTPPGHPGDERGEDDLARLRRLVREQLVGAVCDHRLDLDLANAILAACGLPELPRRWTVRLGLVFTCEVTAAT